MPTKLDAIDRRILSALQRNGRLQNIELAKEVGLSPSPCLRRVRALEEAGVVTGYRALLDAKALGYSLMISRTVLHREGSVHPISWAQFCSERCDTSRRGRQLVMAHGVLQHLLMPSLLGEAKKKGCKPKFAAFAFCGTLCGTKSLNLPNLLILLAYWRKRRDSNPR